MRDFFEKRMNGYDAHMMNNIESARLFYPYTAQCLPGTEECRILDLGCGTGLELTEYFMRNPGAHVTGIDLSEKMLDVLRAKHPDKDLTLLCGSYFDLPFGIRCFDAAVSVESLHHFTMEEKIPLYRKLRDALKDGGYLILTDYFAESDTQECAFREALERCKAEEGIHDHESYHFDTPLTVAHETQALLQAGFSSVQVCDSWGATYTLRANR